MSSYPLIFCTVSGIIIRLALFRTSLPDWISLQPEVSTPLTSWERAMEGIALKEYMISPYAGDLFHETPLVLRILGFMTSFSDHTILLMFVGLDALCLILMVKIANLYGGYLLKKQAKEVKRYATDCDTLIIKTEELRIIQFYVIVAFSLNPYSIAACLAKSTAVFNNLSILFIFYFMLKENAYLCYLFIAMSAYLSIYPITLCVPAAIFFMQSSKFRKNKISDTEMSYTDSPALFSYCRTVGLCVVMVAALIGFSAFLEGSWSFISSTYGFILMVPDLTPNMGVFWYFFTEMFEHFRMFFICVFQINVVIYTVPLSVKLKEHPVFLMYILVSLICIFKSYPSYSDVGLMLSLLPLWRYAFEYMRNSFVVACMYICTTVFGPILYHLWIYAGSANANFYFATSLAFSTAQIFLITDLLYAYLRREFDLENGFKHLIREDGTKKQVILD
ncbi:phosphatidylinositol glycan anchor biosynthesis class U protein-like [Mytilus edulis]|uniref:phosphatidylinositol glycan anchor biosynthesis class U protein-like n=1 Tax=Mytilus edulis TaxID=6550 RepID=UPI0039EDF1F4